MKDIPASQIRIMLGKRYPNASIFILDSEYEVPTKEMLEIAYAKFQRSLWKWSVFKWLRNKWDCDKFAWAFKASVSVGNALSKNNNAQPVGFLCYFENADKARGHAINMAVYGEKKTRMICEIEPQPNNGLKSLTKAERDSAWLVII